MLNLLQKRLDEEPHEDYPVASRIHALNTFPRCFVKRDDELGFSISGSKFRKYRTLIPYLRGSEEVAVIGGAFSNHVLAITQLLIENGIKFRLFLKGQHPEKFCGNFLFLQMLRPAIEWVAKIDWHKIDEIAASYGCTNILPEGAAIFPAFLGALTLPLDIVRNEQEAGLTFNHLFFEVGTGYSAAALLLGFAYLGKDVHCHLLLMAGTEEEFRARLKALHAEFELWLGDRCPFPARFTCETSSIAPSFGSTNRALFDFIRKTAREEGLFLDPIYSGKLFYHAKQKIGVLLGNILLIHSGGALTLAGFQDHLNEEVNPPSYPLLNPMMPM